MLFNILYFPQLHPFQVAAMVVHPNFQFSPAADRFKAINFLSGVKQRYWTTLSFFRFDVAVLKLESPVSWNFKIKMWKNAFKYIILDITRWLTRLTLLRYVCHKLEETQRCQVEIILSQKVVRSPNWHVSGCQVGRATWLPKRDSTPCASSLSPQW